MGLCSHCVGDSDTIYIDDNGGKFCVECAVARCEELENAKKAYAVGSEFDSNTTILWNTRTRGDAGC